MAFLQEEIEKKGIELSIRATKLTARVLAMAIRALLRQLKKSYNVPKAGAQSFKRLDRTIGGDTADIEVVGRIKSFERFARRYGVSYHVEKKTGTVPPTWTVYFKPKHAGNMMGALQKYSAHVLNRSKKPSVRETMQNHRELTKNRAKERAPQHRERGERSGPER